MVDSNKVPVKIYWKEIPPEDHQVKNVLNPNVYNSPGKLINSKYVEANAKPWLINMNKRNKKLSKKPAKVDEIRQVEKTVQKPSNVKLSNLHTVATERFHNNKDITLKDLCKEDKQKVANLIKELSKFGEEKENAIKQLHKTTADFESKLKLLEDDKTKALEKQYEFKDQMYKYELIINDLHKNKDAKDQSVCQHNMKHQMKLDNENIKLIKDTDGELKTFYVLDKAVDNNPSDLASNKSLNDTYAEVFLEQQKKFESQQEALQIQIKQLQQLQESLLKHQNLKNNTVTANIETPNLTKEVDKQKLNITTPSTYSNSHKLDQYLFNSKSSKSDILTSDNPIECSSNKSVVQCENSNSIYSPEQQKTDVCLQTDAFVSEPKIDNYIDVSKKMLNHPVTNRTNKVIGAPKLYISDRNTVMSAKPRQSKKKIHSEKYAATSASAYAHLPSNHISYKDPSLSAFTLSSKSSLKGILRKNNLKEDSIVTRNNQNTTQHKKCYPKDLLIPVDNSESSENDSDDEDAVYQNTSPHFQQKRCKPISPLKRKHFNPSSILLMADGLLPPSTSTSVDQYSLKRSYKRNGLIPKPNELNAFSETQMKTCKKGKSLKEQKTSTSQFMKHKHVYIDEDEEKEVLDDIFFVK